MSFSSDIKEDLSKLNNFKDKRSLESELFGYLLTGNTSRNGEYIEYVTENEYNIERLYKILFSLDMNYEPDINGKVYTAKIKKNDKLKDIMKFDTNQNENQEKGIIRGAFFGARKY